MIFILKTLRAAIVVAVYGAIGYAVWKKFQPAEAAPYTSPYTSSDARPSPTVHTADGPKPAAITDPAEVNGTSDAGGPKGKIDRSAPGSSVKTDHAS